MGGQTKRDNDANLLLARQLPGFGAAGELLSDAASHRASVVWMDFTPELVSIRYQVDGVWHTNASQPRATCDPVLVVLKTISALDPEQRVAHQDGEFGFHFGGVDYKSEITSQGTQTGERVVLKFASTQQFETTDDLGMRVKMSEALSELIKADMDWY